MAENPVNNRKVTPKPVVKRKVDSGESSAIFSKKIDKNLWESASKSFNHKNDGKQSIRSQIFKVDQETKKYQEMLSQDFGNKIDYNC